MTAATRSQSIMKINSVLDVLHLAYKLHNFVGMQGCKKLFSSRLVLPSGVIISSTDISNEDAGDILRNNIMVSVTALAIVLDEALQGAFGKCNVSTESSLRIVVYLLRCAFAHTPAAPKWEIKEGYIKKHSKITILPPSQIFGKSVDQCDTFFEAGAEQMLGDFVFDLQKLDKQPVNTEDFKGLPGLVVLSKMVKLALSEGQIMKG